ncbi:MAG: RNA polymerase sigma factor [Candidatus Zixiibacteriota bacterium]|nr:MAG: RNA polymerase sigma factor [candidate division Zixibacteria bacterium]
MQQLVIKAKQGDKAAETQIFEYLRVRFVLLAKRRIGEEHCEDMAQEACITVLEKLKTDSPEENFEAWAYQVLRNKIGNYLQGKNLRQKKMVSTEHIEYLDKPAAADLDPIFKKRLMDCLRKLIKSNRRYARVLNLAHQGFDTEEICQRMEMKSNHLYVMLNRSRKMLSDCLEGGV